MTEHAMRDKILSAAEMRARTGGYHSFSFRDIAGDVGIKSSSVHYHFPTKPDLVASLTRAYTERAAALLGDPQDVSPEEALDRVVTLFRNALTVDGRMCLCGMLGAESDALPDEVRVAVAGFFELLRDYLSAAGVDAKAGASIPAIIAQLEGGLILARAMGDATLFEDVAASVGR